MVTKPKRILIVEDERELCDNIADFLEDAGHQVYKASDGIMGADLVRDFSPDAVICDIRMPRMNGLSLLRELKIRRPSLPVVMLSGTGNLSDVATALRHGADDFIFKPLSDMSQVQTSIENAILQMEKNHQYLASIEKTLRKREKELNLTLQSVQHSLDSTLVVQNWLLILIHREQQNPVYLLALEDSGEIEFVHSHNRIDKGNSSSTFSLNHSFWDLIDWDTSGTTPQEILQEVNQSRYTMKALKTRPEHFATGELKVEFCLLTQAHHAEKLTESEINTDGSHPPTQQTIFSQSNESKYRNIFNAAKDAILFLVEGMIVDCNPASEQILLESCNRILGNTIDRFISLTEYNEQLDDVNELSASANGDRSRQFNTLLKRRDADSIQVEVTILPVKTFASNATMVVIHDITEKHNLEMQLRQSQKMEAVGRLAGGVAHDFNNLLTVIHGNIDLMKLSLGKNGDVEGYLNDLMNTVIRAGNLTRQLLTFSRKEHAQPVPLNLNIIIKDVHKMLARLIGADIAVETDLCFEELWLNADPTQIEQVIMNLSLNARDAMPEGGCLQIRTRSVRLQDAKVNGALSLEPGQYVVMSVADSGIGIDPDVLNKIFEPFFTTKELGKGTGLGLSTVYGIVKGMKGDIYVDSIVGSGTTFDIYFPALSDAKVRLIDIQEEDVDLNGTEHIAVVEDDNVLRKIIVEILEKRGYQVASFDRVSAVASDIQTHFESIDLIISDIMMPGLSGTEFAKLVLTSYPEIPILLMSGYMGEEVLRHITPEMNIPFIQKPFHANQLLRKVRELLTVTNPRL